MSYTDRFVANVSRLPGVVADRCASVGGVLIEIEPIVDKAGADELKLGCWKIPDVLFSTCANSSPVAFRVPTVLLEAILLVAEPPAVTDGTGGISVSDMGAIVNVVEKRDMLASNAKGGKKGAGDSACDDSDGDGPCPDECDPCLCKPSM